MEEDKKKVALEGQVQEQNKKLYHDLKIKNNQIYLDGFKVKFVEEFSLFRKAKYPTELTLKILVDSKVRFD